jgi:hypothetical protein
MIVVSGKRVGQEFKFRGADAEVKAEVKVLAGHSIYNL